MVNRYPQGNPLQWSWKAIPNSDVPAVTNIPQASVFTGYPLTIGTDVPHDTPTGIGFSAYPLVAGVDILGISKVGAHVAALELTTTSQTQVLTYTPASVAVVKVMVSITVITANTTVTLTVNWTDPNAGNQTYTLENAEYLGVGVRLELPLVLTSAGGTAVTVTATSGTANQVYVSGIIEQPV